MNDIYVRHNVCPVNGINDIASYIRKSFNCPVYSADGALLVLASYCLYISYEEIYETFPLNSTHIDTHVMPSLIEKGLLSKSPFSRIMGVSRSSFRITTAGYKRANEICKGELPNKYKPARKRTKENSKVYDFTTEHTYLSGYNLFSLIPFGLPIEWRREFPFTYGQAYRGSRRKGDLIVDARCSLFPDDREKRRLLYFEEDTGVEHVSVLLDKLEKYRIYHLMDSDRDAVIFSFADKDASASAPSPVMEVSAYSATKCRELMRHMKKNGVTDAFSLINDPGADQDYLRELLLVTGGIIKREDALVRGYEKVTLPFLEEFSLSLKFRRNPYQHKGFNLVHSSLSFKRMVRMVELILSDVGRLPLFARRMSQGFPVYCIPTPLMSDRLPFAFLSEFPDELKRVSDTLSSYFKDLHFVSELSAPLKVSRRGDTIQLRNIFSYALGDGRTGLISVEFISFDLSAWVRSALFLNHMKYGGETPVQLICVFETMEHSKKFFSMMKYSHDALCIMADKCGIYGLMLEDIGKPLKIFSVKGKDYSDTLELKAAFRSDEE